MALSHHDCIVGAPTQSVAGFTGTYTNIGMEIAQGQGDDLWWHVKMLFSFILGSWISALINPFPKPFKISKHYPPTFFIGAVFLFISFGLSEDDPAGKDYYYFAAAANGIQNGCARSFSPAHESAVLIAVCQQDVINV